MKATKKLLFIILSFFSFIAFSQSEIKINVLSFPDIEGYKTLKCDFHTHTAFSDGLVWPSYRIDEAINDGLDVIAITDHIEYRPNKNYFNSDHNTSFEIAYLEGKNQGIIVIKGAEITQRMPPGHINAIFISDANLLDTANVIDAVKSAFEQGAFIFWNHPCWEAQQPDTVKWFDIHTKLYEKGYIHGIEIVNFDQFCPEAWKWANEKNLTILSNSDIHSTTTMSTFKQHRPITIVFVKDYTEKAIKEALFEKRTLAFYDNKLFGDKYWLEKLFSKSIIIEKIPNPNSNNTIYNITNISSVPILLKTIDKELSNKWVVPKTIEIPPNSSIHFTINYKNCNVQKIKFSVESFIYDINKCIEFELDAK